MEWECSVGISISMNIIILFLSIVSVILFEIVHYFLINAVNVFSTRFEGEQHFSCDVMF